MYNFEHIIVTCLDYNNKEICWMGSKELARHCHSALH